MTTDVPFLTHATIAICLAAVGVAAWARRRPTLTGTTLVAPWIWTLLALTSLTAGQVILASLSPSDPGWASHIRYLSAIATFCPAMAVLGGKRPQDRAWQFIVLSLVVILALPSVESLLHRPDGTLRMHAARQWFLAVLVVMGLLNGLPTRHGVASALVAASQGLLLAEHLPGLAGVSLQETLSPSVQGLAGLGLWVAAMVLLGFDIPRRGHVDLPLDRLWLDFRDAFGAVWALRVAERINAASQMYGWGVRLGWRGLRVGASTGSKGELSPEVEAALLNTLQPLLRRFVSPDWIAARLSR